METIYVTQAGQGEHLLVVTDVVTIKASGQETSGNMLVVEVLVPPGGGPPILHRHTPSETFCILEGEFEINTADTANKLSTVKIKAGDTLSIPSRVWHNYKNVGATPGKFIAIQSPAGMENFFREIGKAIEDPLNPPRPAGPPSDEQRQKMMEIILKYMEVLPPDKISR
jgi:mannose-6-phosphate isomerase-like protein (cupin superfamily)